MYYNVESVNVIVPPSAEPVTLNEMKRQVRRPTTYTADDEKLAACIEAARSILEARMGWSFLEQTLRYTLDGWPCAAGPYIWLPRATPLRSVSSITYKPYGDVAVTWASDQYVLDANSKPGRVSPVDGGLFPNAALSPTSAIVVEYVAGLNPNASPTVRIPARIRHAILMLAAHFYQNSETVAIGTLMQGFEMPFSVEMLIAQDSLRAF